MSPLAFAAVPLAGDLLSTRTLGEAVLITVGAFVLGFIVSKILPKTLNPELFGFLTSLVVVAGLAYAGSTGAGLALVILVGFGLLLGLAGVLW